MAKIEDGKGKKTENVWKGECSVSHVFRTSIWLGIMMFPVTMMFIIHGSGDINVFAFAKLALASESVENYVFLSIS